ncbi:small subunit ribosomal protein S25e [Microdochium nivale]|nr:small subunit ribosomal protein S25e [Microdochium nivale]
MAPSATGGKKQKKKWSKGKVKDKAQHAVMLDKATSEKLYKDVQSYRLVTVATLVDRMKINGSLARRCLKDLEEKGQIKSVVTHSKMKIYSTLTICPPHWPPRCQAAYLMLTPLSLARAVTAAE